VLRLLLAAGATPDIQDDDGATPLAEAVLNKQYEAARRLVEAGADIQLPAADGATPLSMAMDQQDQAMIAVLRGPTP
jgi:ankyrin repeat protein